MEGRTYEIFDLKGAVCSVQIQRRVKLNECVQNTVCHKIVSNIMYTNTGRCITNSYICVISITIICRRRLRWSRWAPAPRGSKPSSYTARQRGQPPRVRRTEGGRAHRAIAHCSGRAAPRPSTNSVSWT